MFQILEILKDKDFVGAESKFLDIFLKLEDIVNNSIADPESRIKDLKRQKQEIEQEIERINKQGIVKHYEDYQIKTRIDDVYRLTNELVGDFKEVEDNFREITKNIYEKQAEHSYTKGNLLGYAFDSVDKLKESDQGKSFFSFWHFLLNDNGSEIAEKLGISKKTVENQLSLALKDLRNAINLFNTFFL